jgi:hypothetical protein
MGIIDAVVPITNSGLATKYTCSLRSDSITPVKGRL